jgi:hypothetical protein
MWVIEVVVKWFSGVAVLLIVRGPLNNTPEGRVLNYIQLQHTWGKPVAVVS